MKNLFSVLLFAFAATAYAQNVVVYLDPNGGELETKAVVVNPGHRYCELVNMYSKGDAANYDRLSGEIEDNVISIECDNSNGAGNAFKNFFTKPLERWIVPGNDYAYVLEVLELEGAPMLATGNTEFGDSQLSQDRVKIEKAGTYFFAKKGRDITDPANTYKDYLERAYLYCKAGEKFAIKFRVSLFSGSGVNEDNYKYVAPGETIKVALPTPKREGYRFDGWYDGERKIENDSLVEKDEDHTLVAKWKACAPTSELFTFPMAREDSEGRVAVSFTVTSKAESGKLKLFWKAGDEVREIAALEGDLEHVHEAHSAMRYLSFSAAENGIDLAAGELIITLDGKNPATFNESIAIPVERYQPSLWQRIFGW